MKSKNWYFVVLVCCFFACENGQQEQLRNMDDIAPKAKKARTKKKSVRVKKQIVGFSETAAASIGLAFDSLIPLDSVFFNDRFTAIKNHKFTLYSNKTATIFTQWVFKDSTETLNAFYNWLDCFGSPCKQVVVGQNKAMQRNNFVLLLNDTSYTYITSKSKITSKKWLNYFDTLTHVHQWRFVVEQNQRGKTSWNRYQSGQLTPINK